ncbi:hypothetical protein [Arthrobacter sp.]|uniref:hypothetical protein n=1 Tax=Arthrobacter sp. TaxID=1667 RepID=UPI0026DFFE98|nr:hypothetical protein [Arthrobacter sp.]MDO5753322.1 hypothetical protein [Arthrobacter sp.]
MKQPHNKATFTAAALGTLALVSSAAFVAFTPAQAAPAQGLSGIFDRDAPPIPGPPWGIRLANPIPAPILVAALKVEKLPRLPGPGTGPYNPFPGPFEVDY